MQDKVPRTADEQAERTPELPPDKKFSTPAEAAAARRRYYAERVAENRTPSVIMMAMTFVMEAVMIVLYLIAPYVVHSNKFFPQYIYLYVSMVAVGPVLLVLLHVFKSAPRILRVLEYAVLWILGVWSAVFSAFDVINGFSAYLFIQIMMIDSIIFRMRPAVHCAVNLFSMLVYTAIIVFGRLDVVSLFAEIVNPLFMTAAACVILIFLDRMKFRSFLNQELVREQHRQLEYYANNDYLTKMPNRKSIIESLESAVSRGAAPISCMMIDIDDFKQFNDTYGHLEGDRCLIRLTSVMKRAVDSRGGRVGRYGGEEFLVVFTGKSEEELAGISEDIRRSVEKENIPFSSSSVLPVVTVSIGVYQSKGKNSDQDTLLSHSDKALYRAKKEGKNRVCFYSDV